MNTSFETHNFNDMEQNYLNQIKDLLSNDVRSDQELSDIIGISRVMIYKWRTGKVSNIRNSNVTKIAKALNHSVKVDNDGELYLTPLTFEEIDLANNTIESSRLFDTLSKTTDSLLAEKEEYKAEIKELKLHIRALETDLANKPNMNLDNTRMQFIVNMETQEYVSCTQLYAALFNRDAFDIIKNAQWSHLVHPDDVWRFPIIASQAPAEQEKRNTWKLIGDKNQASYVETVTLPLDKEGILKKVDAKISSKDAWEKSNKWYRTFENKVLN